MDIHCDQEEENRRAWILYAVAFLSIVFAVVLIVANQIDFVFEEFVNIISKCVIHIVQMTPSIMIPISFTVWLSNVHWRLVLMNSFLRYLCFHILRLNNKNLSTNFVFLSFLWLRNYFLQRDKLKGSVIEYKDRSIRAIKFMGHQFLLLTNITNQLNSCYSFKVFYVLYLLKFITGFYLHTYDYAVEFDYFRL